MAKLNHTYYQGRKNALVWIHDPSAFFNMLPNGARLKAESVTPALKTTYGFPVGSDMVYSGVLVGRLPGAKKFTLIDPTLTTVTSRNATTLAQNADSGAVELVVTDLDGIAAGQVLRVAGASNVTVASIKPLDNTVVITAGLSAAVSAGATVDLATSVTIPQSNIYLMMTDIPALGENDEFTLLRHQRAIYQNKLPAWDAYTPQMKTIVQQNYVAFDNLTEF